MKKGLIVITVILFVLILALRYVEEKNGRLDKNSAKMQAEKSAQGISLPKTKDIALTDEFKLGSHDTGLVSYNEAIFLSGGESALGKACENGSIEDIFSEHGRIWGYGISNSGSFNDKENRSIYAHLARYEACRAAALRDVTHCDKLPSGRKGANNLVLDLDSTPHQQCVDIVNRLIFYDFVAGNIKDRASCSLILKGSAFRGIPFSEDVFCTAASKGIENMCQSLKDQGVKVTKKDSQNCYKRFPSKLSGCYSDTCRHRYMLYLGMKNKKYHECPEDFKLACKAYLSKSETPCEKLALELSKAYCGYYKGVAKRAGKVLGMSDEQIKTYKEQAEKDAKEKTRLKDIERNLEMKEKKEAEKLTKEINKRVKKILGKE